MTESMPKLNSLPELTKEQRSYIATGYLMCVQDFMLKPQHTREQTARLISATTRTVEKYLPVDVQGVLEVMVCESNDRPTMDMLNMLQMIIQSLQSYNVDKERDV